MQYRFETRRLLAERPTSIPLDVPKNIPDDALIFNAPRPLYGTKIWTGDFCAGIFYSSLNQDDPGKESVIRLNYELNAVILLYVTDEAAKEEVRAYLIREYGEAYATETTEEEFEEYWRDSFYENFARGEMLLEGK